MMFIPSINVYYLYLIHIHLHVLYQSCFLFLSIMYLQSQGVGNIASVCFLLLKNYKIQLQKNKSTAKSTTLSSMQT